MKKGLLVLLLISFLALPMIGLAADIEPAPVVPFLEGIENVRDLIFTLLMIASVIFVLLGAFQILTAGGDAEKFTQGRTYILYAVVAVIVALMAIGLVDFIREAIE